HRLGTRIAPAPGRRRRPPRLIRGMAAGPPRRDVLGTSSAPAGLGRRPYRQTGPALGTLRLSPCMPILRLERPPARADDSDHGSPSGAQSTPLADSVTVARSQSELPM